MNRLNFCNRVSTAAIVVHLLTVPSCVNPVTVENVFRSQGFLCSGYHFYIDQQGDVLDSSRDSRALGGYCKDTLDICVLCEGNQPTSKQRQELDYLIEALKSDHPETHLHVRRISSTQGTHEQSRNRQ